MILYDDKYNFLGMSTDTLTFLGYEDISEFISIHNDFANLFVQKEGFIYSFDNFSWIDFVLYSGSANKSAIITLKNGQETGIDVSIKEIYLSKNIGESKKLYSVKILSDNFNEISSVPKINNSKNKSGGFTLSGLIKNEPTKEEKIENEKEKENFQNLINETREKDSGDFVLNITEDEFVNKNEQENIPTPAPNDDFKLDLFKQDAGFTDEPSKEDVKSIPENKIEDDINILEFEKDKDNLLDFNLLKDEPKEHKTDTKPSFDFLLKKDEEKIVKSEEIVETPIKTSGDFKLNFLKKDEEIAKESEEIRQNPDEFKLDFLKQDKQKSEDIAQPEVSEFEKDQEHVTQTGENFNFNLKKDDKEIEIESNEDVEAPIEFKLDLLKKDENEIKKSAEVAETPNKFKLNFLIQEEDETEKNEPIIQPEVSEVVNKNETNHSKEKAKIIKKIKKDIKEIDAVGEKIKKPESLVSKFILSIPDEPKDEQILDIEPKIPLKTDEEVSNFQIQENKDVQINNSFTDTLKNLFDEDAKDLDTSNEKPLEFKLDGNEEETKKIETDNFIEDTTTVSEKQIDLIVNDDAVTRQDVASSASVVFPSLSALGLSDEEEFDLVADFVVDAKESVYSIEQYLHTDDFDKINYSLVKIKSSAEILNLDAIIEISNSMRKYCIAEDDKSVAVDTSRLKEQIRLLEKYLEETAV